MAQPQFIGKDSVSGRQLFHLGVRDIADLPPHLNLPSKHFVLLLVWNAQGVSSQLISDLASRLADEGLAYLCAWGSDCERVHDVFDETFVERDLNAPVETLVMTTWHDNEDLREALWFFLTCTLPDDSLADKCDTGLVISMGNDEWEREIVTALSDPRSFNKRVLNDEPGE